MLLECVPNVSLGPQDEALDDVQRAVQEVASPGCRLLDVHTDRDHRRTVFTLAGAPVPLLGVLDELAGALEARVSLAGHEGVHPRVGVLDVVPFVPIGAPPAEVHRVAEAAVDRLAARGIPTYRYAQAARRASTRELAGIRRRLADDRPGEPTALAPDRGPAELHPTMGAACVGVRDPLVAYNVLLETGDEAAGRAIAGEIRASSGGLPGVQALGFPLASREDRVQVSTNITDVDAVTIADVYQAVQQAAGDRGIEAGAGELVGLAPARALPKKASDAGFQSLPASLEAMLREAGFDIDEVR